MWYNINGGIKIGKKIGIVVEYNPFHNGHLYQIEKIREKFGNEALLVVVMSGDFVQRGEFSFFNKWEKTEVALKNGVDIVVELPLYYSIQNAEIFSKMATRILEYLDLDIQVFGAESNEIEKLKNVIELQEEIAYKKKLMEYMKQGNSYGTSQKKALEEYGLGNLVRSNNILALEYMREMKNSELRIKPCIIKREVSEYNENKVEDSREKFASASFIRSEIENYQNNDEEKLLKLKEFVPIETFEILKNKMLKVDVKKEVFKLFKYKFLISEREEILKIYDMTEEIYSRIFSKLKNSKDLKEFLKNMKSRNFSGKRIERLMLNVVLNIKKEVLDFEIEYVRVLGFNRKGQEYLKKLKNSEKMKKVFVNWKDIEKNKGDWISCNEKGNLEVKDFFYYKKEEINNEKINYLKIEVEKMGFLLKELFFGESERLNPVVRKL